VGREEQKEQPSIYIGKSQKRNETNAMPGMLVHDGMQATEEAQRCKYQRDSVPGAYSIDHQLYDNLFIKITNDMART